jgi:hypothetical protein
MINGTVQTLYKLKGKLKAKILLIRNAHKFEITDGVLNMYRTTLQIGL